MSRVDIRVTPRVLPRRREPSARSIRIGQQVRRMLRRTDLFPLAAALLRAGSDRERAQLLLRSPDGILYSEFTQLHAACLAAGFGAGAQYLEVRTSTVSATRDSRGQLPEAIAQHAETWRAGMAAIAGGAR